MKAKLSKGEIEKIIKTHLPFTKVKRWDGTDLILDVETEKLRQEEIRGTTLWIYRELKIKQGEYVVCPIIKGNKTRYFIVIQ